MDRHHCGPECVCPSCGRPTLYNFRTGHACSDPSCENAHGVAVRMPFPRKKGYW